MRRVIAPRLVSLVRGQISIPRTKSSALREICTTSPVEVSRFFFFYFFFFSFFFHPRSCHPRHFRETVARRGAVNLDTRPCHGLPMIYRGETVLFSTVVALSLQHSFRSDTRVSRIRTDSTVKLDELFHAESKFDRSLSQPERFNEYKI